MADDTGCKQEHRDENGENGEGRLRGSSWTLHLRCGSCDQGHDVPDRACMVDLLRSNGRLLIASQTVPDGWSWCTNCRETAHVECLQEVCGANKGTDFACAGERLCSVCASKWSKYLCFDCGAKCAAHDNKFDKCSVCGCRLCGPCKREKRPPKCKACQTTAAAAKAGTKRKRKDSKGDMVQEPPLKEPKTE
jgi:hypothetical protein